MYARYAFGAIESFMVWIDGDIAKLNG